MSANRVSCGIIVVTNGDWLICHSTGNPHWDFPKGIAQEGETHVEAAIRETIEETGLDMSSHVDAFVDLGCAGYSRDKGLHLYLLEYPEQIIVSKLVCTSMVCRGSRQYPEMDSFVVTAPSVAFPMLSKSMQAWLENNATQLWKNNALGGAR